MNIAFHEVEAMSWLPKAEDGPTNQPSILRVQVKDSYIDIGFHRTRPEPQPESENDERITA